MGGQEDGASVTYRGTSGANFGWRGSLSKPLSESRPSLIPQNNGERGHHKARTDGGSEYSHGSAALPQAQESAFDDARAEFRRAMQALQSTRAATKAQTAQ